jgi:hypothetical protein
MSLNLKLCAIEDLAAQITYLRSPIAIRDRCTQLFQLACSDQLRYFRCDLNQLERVADYVIAVTRQQYPDLQIPFHSRWRHFEVGNASRLNLLATQLEDLSPLEKAQAKFDLAIVSVLLDAGAGATWQYIEEQSGQTYRRSEGLAIASFWMFCQGAFSSDPTRLQVDAIALQNLNEATLAQDFQVSETNPLVGLQGRTQLLQQLGETLSRYPHLFRSNLSPYLRPGHLVDYLLNQTDNGRIAATQVLSAVLAGFSDIWPGRITLAGTNLGDTWPHPALSPQSPIPDSQSPIPDLQSLIPFHKLSQWLAYSLLEPLQELGLEIIGLDALTGLPEYRNGGLFVDLGVLQVKDKIVLNQAQRPGSEAIVEWRALTVILLDQVAEIMRQKLNLTATELPLAKVLQGGTWAAGRQIAAELRPEGTPPIQIESDGTVF